MANLFPALVLDAKDYWKVLNVNKFKQLLEETGHFWIVFVIRQSNQHDTTRHNTTQKDTKWNNIFF